MSDNSNTAQETQEPSIQESTLANIRYMLDWGTGKPARYSLTHNFSLGFVELLDIMPHPSTNVTPDSAVVSAARTSFLADTKGEEADKKLLMYLYRNRHTTPMEQVQFKFRIQAPVVTWWQLVRHRTLSLNLMSGRYVEFKEDEHYIPYIDEWRIQSTSNKQGSSGEVLSEGAQIGIVNDLCGIIDGLGDMIMGNDATVTALFDTWIQASYKIYSALLANGVAKEQARLFLPAWASLYTGIITVDAHNLLNFLRLRTAPDAQYEIRMLAVQMEHIFRLAMPWSYEAYKRYAWTTQDSTVLTK